MLYKLKRCYQQLNNYSINITLVSLSELTYRKCLNILAKKLDTQIISIITFYYRYPIVYQDTNKNKTSDRYYKETAGHQPWPNTNTSMVEA